MTAFTVVSLIAALSVGGFTLPPIEPPPMPDFETPVDYRAWYDRQTEAEAGHNALDMYGVFLYAPKDSPNAVLLPKAGTAVSTQLRSLMSRGRVWRKPRNVELHKWTVDIENRFRRAFVDGAARSQYTPRPAPGIQLLADMKPPRLGNARAVGQMMFSRAWFVQGGTIFTDPFIEAVATNLALARHMSSGPTLEEQLFAVGHRDFVYRQIIEALRSKIFTADVWEKVAAAMKKQDAISIPNAYARSLYFSEATALQLLQHFCTQYYPSGEQVLSAEINGASVAAYFSSRYDSAASRPAGVESLAGADPVAIAEAIHAYYEGLRGVLRSPVASDLRKRLSEINEATLGQYPALSALVAPIDMSVVSVFRTEARRRMAYLFVRKSIVFKKTRKWPASFEGLSSADLDGYRTDPFSGRDFLFAPRRDRTAIYSVGPNGTDDGGDKARDLTFWTVVMHDTIDPPEETPPSATDGVQEEKKEGQPDKAGTPSEEKSPSKKATEPKKADDPGKG